MSKVEIRSNPIKFQIIQLFRRTGLLPLADRVLYYRRLSKYKASNQAFLKSNPEFCPPPADLAFDAFNHVSWELYWNSGKRSAKAFCDLIKKEYDKPVSVLEFGCGPARLIRHFHTELDEQLESLTGVDYNDRTITWCEENLKGIKFELNKLSPPLPFPDESFDVVYHFSVFTHLSEDIQKAWVKELYRVLKPNGIMIPTTHGDEYRHLLSNTESIAKYDAGEIIEQGGYKEGKKWFFAIHPPKFVRETLLKDFASVQFIGSKPESDIYQDLWIAKK